MIKRSFDPSKPHHYYRYGRMSDEEQNPRSPDQQFNTIDSTLSRCGYTHWVHKGDYRDDGRSGRLVHKRPGFNQLLEDVKSGVIKAGSLILVHTIERYGRAKKLKAIRDELYKKYGIVILVASNNFADPTNETGEIVSSMEDIRSWSDSAKKAHDVLRGKIDAATEKKWPGGVPPVGFQLEMRQTTRSKRSGREIFDHYSVLVPDPDKKEIPIRIFDLGARRGWGPDKIAANLNADQDFVTRFGKLSRHTVAYIMDNPIYGGTLRFNAHATDIEDDCRIIQRNADDEVVYVEDFCEAIVDQKQVQKVRADVKRRAEARAAIKNASGSADPEIASLGCGVSVKYPLAGLVRCGCCGAAMRVSASGVQSETSPTYYYWHCPNTSDGRCDNKKYLRGPWLWDSVCTSLKQGLFPGIDTANGLNCVAVEELCHEVRNALKAFHQSSADQRPSKEAELAQIERKLNGWRASLANPELSSLLRKDIENDYGRVADRKHRLEAELETLGTKDSDIESRVSPERVVEKLHRLDELLTGANVADLNIELSYHIAAIQVFPGGHVTIHLNRLGALAGNVAELYTGSGEVEELNEPGVFRITPRTLSRRRTNAPIGRSPLDRPAGMMEQVDAPTEWCKVIELLEPPLVFPYQEYAPAIAAQRLEGRTHEELVQEFNMTAPTIRKALKYARSELGIDLSSVPKKMPRADWTKANAAEVFRLKATGMSTLELAEHFGKSDTTIRKALKRAEECGGDIELGG